MCENSRKQERSGRISSAAWVRWVAFLGLLMGIGIGNVNAECTIDSLLKAGNSAYDEYNNDAALEAYQKAYDQCPSSYEAFMKTTRAHIDLGEDTDDSERKKELLQQGLELANNMREEYPDSMMSLFLTAIAAADLAQLSGGREKVKLAHALVDNIRRAIELDPSYSPSHVVLGAYQREVALANDFLKALSRWLFGGVPEGTLEDSERNITKALELDSKNLYAHLELAKTYLAMDRTEEAREHLREVERLPVTTHQGDELKKQASELLGKTASAK